LYAVFFLLSVCALATVGGTLLGFFGGSRTLCIASNATAVGIAMLALATAHPRSSPSVREGWRFLSAAVLVGHGTVLAHTAGVMSARVAVCIALAAAPLAIRGLIRFEGSEARRGSWIAIVLETMSIGAAIAAVLAVWIERVAPAAYGSTSIDLVIEIAAPLGYVLLAGLAVAFALSCQKRHRAALLCIAAWACVGAPTSLLAATAAIGGTSTTSITQFVWMASLLLPLAAAAMSPISGHIGIESDMARAERGSIAVLPIAFAGLALLGYRMGLFGETVAWLALLGLPGAVARIMIMAREHRDAADRLASELAQSRLRQEELVRAKNEAESARRAQQLFLSRTSHELRTPIHILNGFSELLALTSLDSKQTDMISRVRSAGDHLSELVADVLDLSRIDQGHLSVRPEPLDIDVFVIDLLDHLGTDAESRSAALLFGRTGQSTTAVADPARLRQVLTNLLTNAVKYAGGTIVVSTETVGSLTAIHVDDAGPGIPSSDLERVFTPFERLNAELGAEPGAGLGLSVSRSLCEAMGGELVAKSEVGVGSRFTVILPSHIADSSGSTPVADEGVEELGRDALAAMISDPVGFSA